MWSLQRQPRTITCPAGQYPVICPPDLPEAASCWSLRTALRGSTPSCLTAHTPFCFWAPGGALGNPAPGLPHPGSGSWLPSQSPLAESVPPAQPLGIALPARPLPWGHFSLGTELEGGQQTPGRGPAHQECQPGGLRTSMAGCWPTWVLKGPE